MSLPKWSNDKPQVIQVGERTIVIPPRTGVMPGILPVHTHPKYWDEPLRWNPARWISSSASYSPEKDSTGLLYSEHIVIPTQGTFFPWSDGPQNCPGQKFSEVEFVAVLAVLLRNHRVNVVRLDGESFEKAKERALSVTQDCNMEMLLRMRDADQVRLAWKKI